MTHIMRNSRIDWLSAASIGLLAALVIGAFITIPRDDGIRRGPFIAPLQDVVQPAWLAPVVTAKAHSLGLGTPESAAYSKTYWNRAFGEGLIPPPPMYRGTELVYIVTLRYPHVGEPSGELVPATVATLGINAESHDVFTSSVYDAEVFGSDGVDWQKLTL